MACSLRDRAARLRWPGVAALVLMLLASSCGATAPSAGAPVPAPPVADDFAVSACETKREFLDCDARCRRGNEHACARAGGLLFVGAGVLRDDVRARQLSEAACERGVAYACSSTALSYEEGTGGPADAPRAREFARRACVSNDGVGCGLLGVALSASGDLRGAYAARKRGCELNDVVSCTEQGRLLARGEGVEAADPIAAVDMLRRACAAKYARACLLAGVFTPEREGAQARAFFETACGLDSGAGCVLAGNMLEESDPTAGLRLLERGCELGDGDGCTGAGLGRYTRAEHAGARVLFQRGCELKSGDACGALAKLLYQGLGGPPDPKSAAEYGKRACGLGSAEACQNEQAASFYVDKSRPMSMQAGGFVLGSTQAAAKAACLQHAGARWTAEKKEKTYALFGCSRLPVDVFDAPESSAMLTFCERGSLCEVHITVPTENPGKTLTVLRSKLEAKYGTAGNREATNDDWATLRAACSREGRSNVHQSWFWRDGTRRTSRLVLDYTCTRAARIEVLAVIYQDADGLARRNSDAEARQANF
jgi:TPR repeat protein